MLNSTNWVGYASALVLVIISAAAVLLAPSREERRARPLPPIVPMEQVPANYIGNHAFGLWTLVCSNEKTPQPAPQPGVVPPAPEVKRVCRSNAQSIVRGPNNQNLLAAGFNIMLSGPQKTTAILFRLPPAAKAANQINFGVDQNPMFKASPMRCSQKDCIVVGNLPEQALAQLKTGKVLTVVYTANVGQQKRPVRVTHSLHGFREAYDALVKAS